MEFEPKSNLLWGFIARVLYLGIISYLVVLSVAFLRDFIRRLPSFKNRRTPARSTFRRLQSHVVLSADTRLFYYIEIFRLACNILVCAVYIIATYKQNVLHYMSVIYYIIAALVITDIVENIIFSESAISYICRLVVFFDVFTLPSLILASGPNAYLNFAFLRAVVAYDDFAKLEKRLFIQVLGPQRIFVRLLFQCLVLFYTLAAAIQLLEIPGDLLTVEFRDRWFQFGEWNFVNSAYFIIVTLSTVGYGDYSPATVQGRIFTLFIIIVGIVAFTSFVSELVEHSKRTRGSGWFVKNSRTRHVIITGTPNMTDLVHFISEFYADSRRSNIDAKVVVMVEEPLWSDTEWFQHIARNHFLQARLQFLLGSVRNQLDIQRARLNSADAVFILTSPSTGEQPSFQDARTIMNSLAVRNFRTDIPIYAQTLLEDSNLQSEIALKTASSFSSEDTFFRDKSMGSICQYPGLFNKVLRKEFSELPQVHRKESSQCFAEVLQHFEQEGEDDEKQNQDSLEILDLENSEHVCLQEIHMALISGNLEANGVGTLLSNMYLDVRAVKLSKEEPSWLSEYHMGAGCSLTYTIVPKELHEATAKDIAPDLFHMGVLIIATSDPKNIHPRPVLGTDTFLRYGDLVLLLTYLDYKYLCAAMHLVAIRYARGELRHSRSSGADVIPTTLLRRTREYRSFDVRAGEAKNTHTQAFPSSSDANFAAHRENSLSKFANTSGDDLDALADAALCANEEGGSKGLLTSGTSEALREKKTDGYMPDNLRGHIILAMEGDAPLGNLPLLLRNLWRRGKRKSKQSGQKVKVVVVHPAIDEQLRKRFARFDGISLFFVEGPPTSRATWKKARLSSARSVATLADFTQPWSISDARTIFALLTLDVTTRVDHDLFICSELVDEKSLNFLREPIHPRRRGASLGEKINNRGRRVQDNDRDPFASSDEIHRRHPGQRRGVPEASPSHTEAAHSLDESRKLSQSKCRSTRRAENSMGMDRNFSIGGFKSAKPTEAKGPNAETLDRIADEFGSDPSSRPGAARARRGTLFSRSRYASGELLVQSSAITLLAREYIEPGFVKFFTSMLGTDPSSPGMKIRLVGIPESMFDPSNGFTCSKGRKLVRYNDVFKILIHIGVTPLGIYRSGVAPILIPSKVRRRRGHAIFNELEPLLDARDCGPASKNHKGTSGRLETAVDFCKNVFTDVVPYLRRDAEGREELDGKDDDSSSDELSSGEEEQQEVDPDEEFGELQEEVVIDDPRLEQSENQEEPTEESTKEGKRVRIALSRRNSSPKESTASLAQRSASLATWLSPRRTTDASKFFFDDDESLEVPGHVKYVERDNSGNLLPYVYTLPDPNTWCAPKDGIYIFCHPSFELPSKWLEATALNN